MKIKFGHGLGVLCILSVLVALQAGAIDEYSDAIEPMLEVPVAAEPANETPKVTAVYGAGSEDYLPLQDARRQFRPDIRRSSSRASFNLPDAFYYIGAPVFLIMLMRVLVIFINGFEEQRREELNVAASEHMPIERNPDE